MREGAYPFVSAIFYRAVVQAVLIFGSETWMLLVAIEKRPEGFHMVFHQKVTGKTACLQWDGKWKRKGEASFLRETGPQNLGEYIYCKQTTVAEWVTLRPIYEVCEKETGYDGGGMRR